MSSAIRITIDRSGRIVVPRPIRDAAGLEPGAPLDISYRHGVVEIAPAPAEVEVVAKGRLAIAVPVQPVGALTSDEVEETIGRIRDGLAE